MISLLLLPPDVLLIILQALRPAKKDCWSRRFHHIPPAKKDWDALSCSCRALRDLVGSCITVAVVTPSCKHLGFPSHATMTELRIKGERGAWNIRNELDVRHALLGALKLDPSEPNPASTSRIEAVEVHFTDVSGARMSICACIGLCAISIGRGEEVIGKLQGNLLYTGTGKLGMHVGEIVNINN